MGSSIRAEARAPSGVVVHRRRAAPLRRPVRRRLYLRAYDQRSVPVGRELAGLFRSPVRERHPHRTMVVRGREVAMKLMLGLVLGALFGAVLQLSGASSHTKIINALRLKDLTIMKLILTAIGVGLIGVHLFDAFHLANMKVKDLYL